ncbi:MAG: reverse transcriptase domain-containing protein [Nanoarchaeota archaeon]|nr:reverse transcriptase domain-containing protein [Nanoarchaeota archaeon]
MKTYKNIYSKIYNLSNLILAWRKARKGKTKKKYVIEFEKDLIKNLLNLQKELKGKTYCPKPLVTFILRDPKTRKISKSAFRDRIVHHALHNVIEPIFDRIFIYDSCANRLGKGNLFALKRFYKFIKKISGNGIIIKNEFEDNNFVYGYCFKADIKHYFDEVEHEILINILKRKIRDEKVIWLITKVLKNCNNEEKGMPLGNLTSQFFANVYLDKFDKFVKHNLKAKYYIRYVDDFVILHSSKEQLEEWKQEIDNFLKNELKLELHSGKSRILPLSKGIDFVGFRNFYYFKLLRKRNLKKILVKIKQYKKREISYEKILEIFQGWNAYAKWANSLTLRREVVQKIYAKTHL